MSLIVSWPHLSTATPAGCGFLPPEGRRTVYVRAGFDELRSDLAL